MEFLQNDIIGISSIFLLVVGIVLFNQKDTEDKSKKTTRDLGVLIIVVAAVLFLYRASQIYKYGINGRGLSGGARCVTDPFDPNCTVKKIDYSGVEKFLSLIGLDFLAQKFARGRLTKI